MTINVKVGGVWKNVPDPRVRAAGVWKAVLEGHVKVAGVWKKFFTAGEIYIPLFAEAALAVGGDCTINVTFNTNGALTSDAPFSVFSPLSWWTANPVAGAGTPYELRVTVTAGTMTAGTTSAWLPLTSPRTFTKTQPLSGDSTVTFTVEFRRVSDSVVVFTKTGCTIQCQSDIV